MPSFTAERLARDVQSALASAHQGVDALLSLPAATPARDVLAAADRIRWPLDESFERIGLFSSVHPEVAMREASEALERELVAFDTDLSLRRDVYDRLAAVDATADLDDDERRLLEHTLRDFRRSGVDRDEATRARVRALREELVEVGQAFDRNIIDSGREVRVEGGHADLGGLPEDWLESHPEAPDGSVTLTTDAPDYLPVLLYAENGELRKRMFVEFQNRAAPENLEVLDRLLACRHELATLLGYAHWADYVTEDMMVERASTAREFIERVSALARSRAEEERGELLAEKRQFEPEADDVHEWERMYLSERVKRSRYGFDSLAVRPYFAYDNVKRGLLETSAELYGVSFERNTDLEVWHEDVECWDITDDEEVVARFYLDMFPRDGKYKHAAMFGVRHGLVSEGRLEVVPEAALVCNFPEPSTDDPALLLHTQVTTFFHEFGHLLHHLFGGRQRFLRFSGLQTERDFVEVPSQLYEEWAWDVDVLQTFATHVDTKEPIPAELVAKLREAEEYGKGVRVSVQMFYAMLALTYFDRDPAGLDTTAVVRELRESMTPFAHIDGTHFQAGFGHLHGYSAAYYTYMWSHVICKDLLSAFECGLMDRETATRYRERILAPGGSRDASAMVRDFLGRGYRVQAWEAWLNS